jgi:hypothetical protein
VCLIAENISVVGTDDCTTCLAVVLRHPGKSASVVLCDGCVL